MKFRPDIEGLRALAIVPVVVFHAFPALLPGGFVGVDVFFVISGYLITQLLLQRLAAGQYSIRSFYGARIRRIFPALFCMLALVVPAALWLLSPAGLTAFARTLGATAVFASNVELYRTTGYFDAATELKPLVHTWSLAVEEQYYIVFPLLLAWLHRRCPQRIPAVLAVVGLASLAASSWWVRADAPLAFYSSLSRTFELMIGSLLALGTAPAALAPRVREALAAAGLAMILAACAGFSAHTPFPGVAALLPCVGAALIIWTGGQGETLTRRLVSLPPLRFLGAQSFSLYLWHWPILVFARHLSLGEPRPWQAALAVGLAVLMAQLSLRWVEMPVRRASHSDRRLLGYGAVCIAATLALSWLLVQKGGWLQPLSDLQQRLHQGAQDFNKQRRHCHDGPEDVIAYKDRCLFGAPGGPRDTAVWADSHGAELAPALGEAAAPQGRAVVQITSSSCPPAPGFEPPRLPLCAAHNAETLQALLADPQIRRVVLIARYEHHLRSGAQAFESGLLRAAQALAAGGKQVLLLEPVPGYGYPVPAALAALAGRGQPLQDFGQPQAEYRRAQQPALEMLERIARQAGVTLVPTGQLLCGGGRCEVVAGEQPLYFDDNHLSMAGARRLAAAIGP